MINFWADRAKLRKFVEERNSRNTDVRWMGGRFPPDGAWFPIAPHRRIEPCHVCGKQSVTLLMDYDTVPTGLLWLCDTHERLFYSLLY